jgi:hypothetical protein
VLLLWVMVVRSCHCWSLQAANSAFTSTNYIKRQTAAAMARPQARNATESNLCLETEQNVTEGNAAQQVKRELQEVVLGTTQGDPSRGPFEVESHPLSGRVGSECQALILPRTVQEVFFNQKRQSNNAGTTYQVL